MKKLLIVDDEMSVRESLRIIFKNDFNVFLANNGEEAFRLVESNKPDVVLLDIIMPGINGIEILKRLRSENEIIKIIMLTATKTLKTAVDAMKMGAFDYITKPFGVSEIKAVVENAVSCDKEKTVKEEIYESNIFEDIIGKSDKMKNIFEIINKIADTESTVLITGESGTGKELVANAIHNLSLRKKKPFIAINCAAIPETLIESELFGTEKGAYTGSVSKRIGKFEMAQRGTLFLDEIGDITFSMQAKILRVIQEREFTMVGGQTPVKVDIRIVAATNKNLEKEVSEGRFRSDLFYRINVVPVNVPPLRERKSDIEPLTKYFLKRKTRELKCKEKHINKEAMQILNKYGWPGNIRELENTIERLVVLSGNSEITKNDLPEHIRKRTLFDELKKSVASDEILFEEAESELEKELIMEALKKSNFVQTRAADILGISRRVLKYKMDKLGIDI